MKEFARPKDFTAEECPVCEAYREQRVAKYCHYHREKVQTLDKLTHKYRRWYGVNGC